MKSSITDSMSEEELIRAFPWIVHKRSRAGPRDNDIPISQVDISPPPNFLNEHKHMDPVTGETVYVNRNTNQTFTEADLAEIHKITMESDKETLHHWKTRSIY